MPKSDCKLSQENLRQAYQYLSNFQVGDRYRSERDAYLDAHLRRFLVSRQMIPSGLPGDRLLELGAAPYLMTLLLKRSSNYELFVADYRSNDPLGESTVVLQSSAYGEQCTFPCRHFNVEQDCFPYPDGFFHGVLCCELLEHLVLDPTHMLVEIHRVLMADGWVLITTPNVLALRNLNALLRKRKNIYAPYSGYGVYGRHNREWTLDEVTQLVSGCGFCVKTAQTVDTYPHPSLSAMLKRLSPHLRDMICVLARAEGERRAYYPGNLYVAMHADHL